MSETWIINESPNVSDGVPTLTTIPFVSNGTTYSSIEGYAYSRTYYLKYDNTVVYQFERMTEEGSWTDTAYRTVTFETSPTGDLLSWLTENAVKQEEPSNALMFGSLAIDALKLGTADVNAVYFGEDKVYEKASSEETWLINDLPNFTVHFSCNFISNGTSFTSIAGSGNPSSGNMSYDSTDVFYVTMGTTEWVNEAYRTITFSTAPTGDLLTWLTENAVKQ